MIVIFASLLFQKLNHSGENFKLSIISLIAVSKNTKEGGHSIVSIHGFEQVLFTAKIQVGDM